MIDSVLYKEHMLLVYIVCSTFIFLFFSVHLFKVTHPQYTYVFYASTCNAVYFSIFH